MVGTNVYIASNVCINGHKVAALCWSWLECAEPLRKAMSVE
jgi:hypothetical protein